MNKKQLIQEINDRYDWFIFMQKGLGHDSWWYTNRSADDCIDVKIHAWVDQDELISKLSKKSQKLIIDLGINIEEWINDIVWGDYGLVKQAREDLQEELTEKYNVSELEYGGKSGGWLCVVYNWNEVYDDYGDGEYTIKELQSFLKIIDGAELEVSRVNNLVKKRKLELEKQIEDDINYIEELENYIDQVLENKQEESRRILSL